MPQEIKVPGGKYSRSVNWESLHPSAHFAIDCECGGKNGGYIKSGNKTEEETLDDYNPSVRQRQIAAEHTFYMREHIFLDMFLDTPEHNERFAKESVKPLTVACNSCGREFQFTYKSYIGLFGIEDRYQSKNEGELFKLE